MNRLLSHTIQSSLTLAAVVAFSLGGASTGRAQDVSGGIRQAMTPEEFKAAGLEKLTPNELAKLDAFLKGDREKAVAKATEKETKRQTLQLVVSRVDGEITGIFPNQIIALEDGSTWKVAKTDFQFHGAVDHPAAAAYKTIFGWKMRIANVAEIYVVPVKH